MLVQINLYQLYSNEKNRRLIMIHVDQPIYAN